MMSFYSQKLSREDFVYVLHLSNVFFYCLNQNINDLDYNEKSKNFSTQLLSFGIDALQYFGTKEPVSSNELEYFILT